MEPTIIVAAGVIVSVVIAVIAIRSYSRDEADLQVNASFLPKTGRGTAFEVHLHNAGGRPVHVKSVQLVTKNGEVLLSPFDAADVNLGAADDHNLLFPLFNYRKSLEHPLDVKRVEVYDATRKKYVFRMRKLRRQIRQWAPEGNWLNMDSEDS